MTVRVYVEGHRRLRGARTRHGFVSFCECGWESPLCQTTSRAEETQQIHAALMAERAATVIEQDDAAELPDDAPFDEGEAPS